MPNFTQKKSHFKSLNSEIKNPLIKSKLADQSLQLKGTDLNKVSKLNVQENLS